MYVMSHKAFTNSVTELMCIVKDDEMTVSIKKTMVVGADDFAPLQMENSSIEMVKHFSLSWKYLYSK